MLSGALRPISLSRMENPPPVLPVIATNRSRAWAWAVAVLSPETPQGIARLLVLSQLYSLGSWAEIGLLSITHDSHLELTFYRWWFLGPGRLLAGGLGVLLATLSIVGMAFPKWQNTAAKATILLAGLLILDLIAMSSESFRGGFAGFQIVSTCWLLSRIAFLGLAIALQRAPDGSAADVPDLAAVDPDPDHLPYAAKRERWPTGLITAAMLGDLIPAFSAELQLAELARLNPNGYGDVASLLGVSAIWWRAAGIASCAFAFILLRGRLLRQVFTVGLVIATAPNLLALWSDARTAALVSSQDVFRTLGFFGTLRLVLHSASMAVGTWGLILVVRMHDARRGA